MEPGKKEEVIPQCLPESRTEESLESVKKVSAVTPFPSRKSKRVVGRQAKHKPGY